MASLAHVAPLIPSTAFLMGTVVQGMAVRSFRQRELPVASLRTVFVRWTERFGRVAFVMLAVYMLCVLTIGYNILVSYSFNDSMASSTRWIWLAGLAFFSAHLRPVNSKVKFMVEITMHGYKELPVAEVEGILENYKFVNNQHLVGGVAGLGCVIWAVGRTLDMAT